MKEFNDIGVCIPEKHYMVDISEKLNKVIDLVQRGRYFVINKPRQYGKTTTLYMLENALRENDDYLTISISFEGIGDLIFEEEEIFAQGFLKILSKGINFKYKELIVFLKDNKNKVRNLEDLSDVITDFIVRADKKTVLMIDEVDKSSNNQLFLSFLGMLRSKYLLESTGKDRTFYSVILAGVHDVKSLKIKIRDDEQHKYNSPWNIASDFDVDMSFSKEEIGTMLEDYIKNKNVELDKEYFSEKLYFYTSGYPFLVSKICKIIDEKIMSHNKLIWENEYLDKAVKEILKSDNTNFESVIKNLENNNNLYEIVKKLLISGLKIDYNVHNPAIGIGILYGVLGNDNGKLIINNKVYEQLIYGYMTSKIQTSSNFEMYNDRENFITHNGELDIIRVIIKFQEFMKHEYSQNRKEFLEEDGRMIFLAFLSPIINGTGFAFKEVRGGDEKRFDIVITYQNKMYILELKIWRGEEYHKKGLTQLGEYLEQYGLKEGYLLIFDFRKNANSNLCREVTVGINQKDKHITEFYC